MNKKSTLRSVANDYLTHPKSRRGITLIALVITIIVLLILAGVSIAMLSGDNSILGRASSARETSGTRQIEERVKLAYTGALTNGKGTINQESLEEELTKEFGAKGTAYTIADSETGTEWVVTVKGTGAQADVPVTIPKPSNVASIPEATPTPALPTEAEVPKGPNGKPLVNQTTMSELAEDKIVGEDKYGNQVVIPEGFKLAQGANGSGDCVKDGIVIDDGVGNQFVWIPVSNINHDGSNKIKVNSADEEGIEITLGRYTFATISPGDPTLATNSYQYADSYATPVTIQSDFQELTTYRQSNGLRDRTGTNTTARGVSVNNTYNGIQGFIESVEANKGYYIARYEASYRANGKAGSIPSTSSAETLELTSAPSTRTAGDLWNCVNQGEAANACYDLYATVNSDLMNSYAWDTAIVYIQAMGNTNYTNAYDANAYDGNGTLKNTGVTGDEKCKIFDMAGNECEWTTEYSTRVGSSHASPCVSRGGDFENSNLYTKTRSINQASVAYRLVSFRPALYF